jgi:hypothetical protein
MHSHCRIDDNSANAVCMEWIMRTNGTFSCEGHCKILLGDPSRPLRLMVYLTVSLVSADFELSLFRKSTALTE